MNLFQTEVETFKSLWLPFDETIIVPIGDVQYGSPQCDVDRFKRHIDWAMERSNTYLVGLGDYIDLASPSNRQRIQEAALYDTPMNALDTAANIAQEELQEILKNTKGRWLGLVSGHHFWKYDDGTTTDMRLANYLGCPFLGACAIVQVRFKAPSDHLKHANFKIFLHHGKGSGQLQSSPLNVLEKFAGYWDDIDVFLMGHQHKKVAAKMQRIRPVFGVSPKLRHRSVILAGTGGFLKGYDGGYVENKMLTPVVLGGIAIWARPRISKGYVDVDLDISL